jgi:hypothetical protein
MFQLPTVTPGGIVTDEAKKKETLDIKSFQQIDDTIPAAPGDTVG